MSILFIILIFIILSEYIIGRDLTMGYKALLYSKIPTSKKSMQDIMMSSTEPPLSKRSNKKYENSVNIPTKEYTDYINDVFKNKKENK